MTKWKVGITGGIGSGKTYCARIFSHLGIPIYNSDERAQWIMLHDPEVRSGLLELLGQQTYTTDGKLNKEFLRTRVFGSPSTRESINAIVHPAVGRDYEQWHARQTSPYTLKEAALLVESGSYLSLDHLIMVRAPITLRFQRVMARDFISAKSVLDRMASQLADEEKERVSDLKIDNSGCYPLLPQILHIHKYLLR